MVQRFTWSQISKPKPPDISKPKPLNKAKPFGLPRRIKKERVYLITAWVIGCDLAQVCNLIGGLAEVQVHRSRPMEDKDRPTDDE